MSTGTAILLAVALMALGGIVGAVLTAWYIGRGMRG